MPRTWWRRGRNTSRQSNVLLSSVVLSRIGCHQNPGELPPGFFAQVTCIAIYEGSGRIYIGPFSLEQTVVRVRCVTLLSVAPLHPPFLGRTKAAFFAQIVIESVPMVAYQATEASRSFCEEGPRRCNARLAGASMRRYVSQDRIIVIKAASVIARSGCIGSSRLIFCNTIKCSK